MRLDSAPYLPVHNRDVDSRSSTPPQRVLTVGPLPPKPLTGGIEIAILTLLESPLKEWYDMQLFNTARQQDPTRPLWKRLAYQIRMFFRFGRAVVKLQPDVVHIHTASGLNFFQNIGYCTIARAFRRRTLLHNHGGEFDVWYDRLPYAGRIFTRACLKFPSQLIVLSSYWRDLMSTLAPGKTIQIVPNCIDLSIYHGPLEKPDTEALKILTIGEVGHRKGHFDILKAASKLSDLPIHFLFAGPQENETTRTKLDELAHKLGVADRVSFLGPVGPKDKLELLLEADIYLLPSHAENLPIAILEAMAAALPIVSSTVGALPEVLSEGRGAFLVEPGNIAGINTAVRKLAMSPSMRYQMGLFNLGVIKSRYTTDHIAGLLATIYSGRSTHPPGNEMISKVTPRSDTKVIPNRIRDDHLERETDSTASRRDLL